VIVTVRPPGRPTLLVRAVDGILGTHRWSQSRRSRPPVAAIGGRYGIDGGYAGLAVFDVIEAGWRAPWPGRRQRTPAIAALAAVGGTAVAGSAASYLYSTGPGKRAI
jgi:hypothetical protein